jgi:hypothetical protein
MIFFDTESIGFYGPTVLIQYCVGDGDGIIHNIWTEPVYKTLKLIERLATDADGLVGFNLSHDIFHLNRTYGCLSQLPLLEPPSIEQYADIEDTPAAHDKWLVKPNKPLDLMLYGRKGEFQATLNQKDIYVRRIPKIVAKQVVAELTSKVKIPDIYFSRGPRGYEWQIKAIKKDTSIEVTPEDFAKIARGELDKSIIDESFVNLKLSFNPSSALKAIIENVIYKDKLDSEGNPYEVKTLDDIESYKRLPKVQELGYWPSSGVWVDAAQAHIWEWTHNTELLKYAKNDPIYTRDVYRYFNNPPCDDSDSQLACLVGAVYWRGFNFDKKAATAKMESLTSEINKCSVNVNSHNEVREYLLRFCAEDGPERVLLTGTGREILEALVDSFSGVNDALVKASRQVLNTRRLIKKKELIEKMLEAGRVYVHIRLLVLKVIVWLAVMSLRLEKVVPSTRRELEKTMKYERYLRLDLKMTHRMRNLFLMAVTLVDSRFPSVMQFGEMATYMRTWFQEEKCMDCLDQRCMVKAMKK